MLVAVAHARPLTAGLGASARRAASAEPNPARNASSIVAMGAALRTSHTTTLPSESPVASVRGMAALLSATLLKGCLRKHHLVFGFRPSSYDT